jgi:uncharacterized membrane protein YgcG
MGGGVAALSAARLGQWPWRSSGMLRVLRPLLPVISSLAPPDPAVTATAATAATAAITAGLNGVTGGACAPRLHAAVGVAVEAMQGELARAGGLGMHIACLPPLLVLQSILALDPGGVGAGAGTGMRVDEAHGGVVAWPAAGDVARRLEPQAQHAGCWLLLHLALRHRSSAAAAKGAGAGAGAGAGGGGGGGGGSGGGAEAALEVNLRLGLTKLARRLSNLEP